jgi:predicted PurR-regulated permease PerM
MSGMTGLNPAVVFISVLTGSQLGGLLGLLLAVPIAGFIKRIADRFRGSDPDSVAILLPQPVETG